MDANEVSGKLEANEDIRSTCKFFEAGGEAFSYQQKYKICLTLIVNALLCLLLVFCLPGCGIRQESVLACFRVKNVEGKDNVGATSGG